MLKQVQHDTYPEVFYTTLNLFQGRPFRPKKREPLKSPFTFMLLFVTLNNIVLRQPTGS